MNVIDTKAGCTQEFNIIESIDKKRLLLSIVSYPTTFYTSISVEAAREFAENILEAADAISDLENTHQARFGFDEQQEAA